jgi:hypothetical protein
VRSVTLLACGPLGPSGEVDDLAHHLAGRFDEAAAMVLGALESGFIEGSGPYYPQPRVEIRPRPLACFQSIRSEKQNGHTGPGGRCGFAQSVQYGSKNLPCLSAA